MARPTTLDKLMDLAQQKTDNAARNLAALNASEQDAESKLNLLIAYREDYRTRFQKSVGTGIEPAAWRNFRAFLDKLDAAIAEQRKAVAESKRGVHAGQQQWQAEQRRLKSYDTLALRRQRDETRRTARSEQREQDEHAMRICMANKPRSS